jgi:hypothetical protein
MEAWQAEALRDIGRNQIKVEDVTATASSMIGSSHDPRFLVDGRHASNWLCDREDQRPSFHLQFGSAIRTAQIKLSTAYPYDGDPHKWARPKDIQIRINGGKPQALRLPDKNRSRFVFNLPAITNIRALSVEIHSVYPGKGNEYRAAGFSEIELYREIHSSELLSSLESPTYLLPLAHHEPTSWRYTTEAPSDSWMDPTFRDVNWKRGDSGFGDGAVVGGTIRTPWKSKDIWLRREFKLPYSGGQDLRIEIQHDDDAEVFINGVLAVSSAGHTPGGYRTWTLSEAARATLSPGRNTIAVHVTNTGGAAYFDLGLVQMESR